MKNARDFLNILQGQLMLIDKETNLGDHVTLKKILHTVYMAIKEQADNLANIAKDNGND